ncbi:MULTISPECIES: Na+/H+ antiporter NhaA [Sphingobium]|nr:Na+/H+ antiporter NhaA [Sphingobium yanoikuyae]
MQAAHERSKEPIADALRLPLMAITSRQKGASEARAHHSPANAAFLDRLAPFFAGSEVTGGPLLVATFVALLCVNLPISGAYERFWDTPLVLSFGEAKVSHSLAEWIDHALLPLFFIVIGVDVKRELTIGALTRWRTAAFPIVGALGGLIVPVLLFLAVADGTEAARGWGIVITMDTAFGLSVIALFSARLPAGVRALFLAFAAIDDIGGLLAIAFGYSDHFAWEGAVLAGFAIALIILLRRLHWVASVPYVLLAALVWIGIFQSGVHATIAGVLIGFLVPVRPRLDRSEFAVSVQHRVDQFQEAHERARVTEDEHEAEIAQGRAEDRLGFLHEMTGATDKSGERLILTLTPWISYVVLPLFALSNIRIRLSMDLLTTAATSTLALAIVIGLTVGKPLGFLTFSWIAARCGLARLPEGVDWRMIAAIGCLAGIGFTISLFIAGLAFPGGEQLDKASLAVLVSSILSGAIGMMALATIPPTSKA